MRPTWDEYFIGIACKAAERSTCDRANVGCLLVRDNRILATGYNGSPSRTDHCDEVGHEMVEGHCVRTIHAEVNAVIQCAIHGISCKGATAYMTHAPCYECAKVLINAGIVRVVYTFDYRPNSMRDSLLEQAKVEVLRCV